MNCMQGPIIRTAILVDGGFYRRRAQSMLGEKTAAERADELSAYCRKHIRHQQGKHDVERLLYRIFTMTACPWRKRFFIHSYRDKSISLGRSYILGCWPSWMR